MTNLNFKSWYFYNIYNVTVLIILLHESVLKYEPYCFAYKSGTPWRDTNMQGQMFFIFILYFSRCLVVVSAVASLRHITTRRSWTMIAKITKCCQGHTFPLHRFRNVFFASFLLFWLVFNLYANNRWPTVTSENVLFNWPILYRNFSILKIDMFNITCSILPIYKHFFLENSTQKEITIV